jgi:hypothetical protein
LNSNAKFVFATAVAVILVAGALTLPLAFDDHMADAKKKKSYKKHSSKAVSLFAHQSETQQPRINKLCRKATP